MEKVEKAYNYIAGVLSVVLLGLAAYGIHDMQTAEGVGLYFALQTGGSRGSFDLTVDGAAVAALLALILLPVLAGKKRSLREIFRFECLFLAFMPVLSMAYLLRPLEMEWDAARQTGILWLQTVLPMILVLSAVLSQKQKPFRKGYGGLLIAASLCGGSLFFLPSLQQLMEFVMAYLLLLLLYDLYERVKEAYRIRGIWEWILFGGLTLRGIYRMIVLTSIY